MVEKADRAPGEVGVGEAEWVRRGGMGGAWQDGLRMSGEDGVCKHEGRGQKYMRGGVHRGRGAEVSV